MKGLTVPANCTGCTACTTVCPKGALTMQRTKEGFYRPLLNSERCVDCKLCNKVCPIQNCSKESRKIIHTYMAKNRNSMQRQGSSSGGIFPVLAKHILDDNGTVYAAVGIHAVDVKHIRIDCIENLSIAQGSKYIQSDLSGVFSNIQKDLADGKSVLFIGTPCQVYGLKASLGKADTSYLYTIDLVCHGVLSANIPYEYLKTLGYRPEDVRLRWTDKKTGWHHRSMVVSKNLSDENRLLHSEVYNTSLVGQLYQANVCLNECCYTCEYKTNHSTADITLGDYWGIENVNPEFDDDQGVSLIVTHTQKGNELFQSVNNQLFYQESSFEDATKGQYALLYPSKKFFDNTRAYQVLKSEGIEKLYKVVCHKSLFKKIMGKLKKIKHSIQKGH